MALRRFSDFKVQKFSSSGHGIGVLPAAPLQCRCDRYISSLSVRVGPVSTVSLFMFKCSGVDYAPLGGSLVTF